MDGLGLRTFDVASFEHTFEQLITGRIHLRRQINSRRHTPSHEEPDHFLNDPVAACLDAYPHSLTLIRLLIPAQARLFHLLLTATRLRRRLRPE